MGRRHSMQQNVKTISLNTFTIQIGRHFSLRHHFIVFIKMSLVYIYFFKGAKCPLAYVSSFCEQFAVAVKLIDSPQIVSILQRRKQNKKENYVK